MNYSHKSGLSKDDYMERVFEILETFDYPSMVCSYCEFDVAKSIHGVIHTMYICNESAMMCAVLIWSLTWNMQILPDVAESTKH